MNFMSDNVVGVAPAVIDWLTRANTGSETSYGADSWTKRFEEALCELFERDVAVFLVSTGTAANALSLAAISPMFGAVLCHEESHINTDECAAPELFTGGAKLVPIRGRDVGKIDVASLDYVIGNMGRAPHAARPSAVSITQATEYGTVYSVDEIASICRWAQGKGLRVHMDGARFANALVRLGASAAEMTWKAGVDILSFGFTKNGAMGLEAVVMFDRALAEDFPYLRKRTGHLWSKGRFLGAQGLAMLEDGIWLRNAEHANRMAARLLEGLAACPGVRFPIPVEANALFPIVPVALEERLRNAGARFLRWSAHGVPSDELPSADETMIRLVTSFQTSEEEVETFVRTAAESASVLA